MNIPRLKQLQRRIDRLKDMVESQTGTVLALAEQQLELERKAYAEAFGPKPDVDPKNSYGAEWLWSREMWKTAARLDPSNHLRVSEWNVLEIESWTTGCRGNSDEREDSFTLDERITSEEGRASLYAEYVQKYRAIKDKKDEQARAARDAEREQLEKRLRELGGQPNYFPKNVG